MARLFKSERGRDKLVDEANYIYEQHRRNACGTKIYWVCEQRPLCQARVQTMSDNPTVVVSRFKQHLHPTTAADAKAREKVSTLKACALQSQEPCRGLLSSAVADLTEEERAQFPPLYTLSRNIRRWRQIEENAPPVPQERHGYVIPEEFQFLQNGEQFLQFDSGQDDKNRILIFASNEGLNDLASFPSLAGDGTFKVSPDIFYQVYTLHIQEKSFSIPRVFALLPNKSEETYL
jgi:hypothetical protein